MFNSFFQEGRPIKMEVEVMPPYLSFGGIIGKVNEEFFIVEIEGQYVQNNSRKVKCKIPNESKLCVFETIIQEAKGNKLLLLNPRPDEVKIVQRREYVRVPVDIEVCCHLVGVADQNLDNSKIFNGKIRDISGGGVQLSTELSLPIGTILVFELELENNSFVLTARVVRNLEDEDGRTRNLGCEFIGIDESERQKIISYCSKRQLYLKKKII